MKLTTQRLKEMIRKELKNILNESYKPDLDLKQRIKNSIDFDEVMTATSGPGYPDSVLDRVAREYAMEVANDPQFQDEDMEEVKKIAYDLVVHEIHRMNAASDDAIAF